MNVVAFEARHSKTVADLLLKQGAVPFSAPAMKEIPLENNPDVFGFAEKLFAGKIDILILLTGVGTRALAEILETKYPREQFLEALRKTKIVPRGPKPIRVLNEWKVPFAVTVPEPNTWKELMKTIDEWPLRGKTVAVQEYGVPNPELIEGLKARGAAVLRVPVYRWALPDDVAPLEEAIRRILRGEADVALFTTAVQISHLFQVFDRMAAGTRGREPLQKALNRIVVASVGPDCSEALRTQGIRVDIEPESPKMGPLVVAVGEKAAKILERKRAANDAVGASLVLAHSNDGRPQGSPLQRSYFLMACRREKTEVTPVWLMRQAGRYMKEYRDLREKKAFLELCKDPALAAEITVSAQERIHADAAILFSDILLIVEPMGLKLDYPAGDGPSIQKPLQNSSDVDRLAVADPKKSMPFVLEALRQARRGLKPFVPLIGFAGAPFTLASYMIEGGSTKDFSRTRKFMLEDASRWRMLMQKIADGTAAYLQAQVEAGANALQLFDSWAGVLAPQEYRQYAMPYSKAVFDRIRGPVPCIHFGTNTAPFLDAFAEAGGDVVGVDHRIGLKEAWKKIGPEKAVQGNLDPQALLGDLKSLEKEVKKILREAGGKPGHIFNLGHGVLPSTPVDNVKALVEMVHEFSR